MDKKYVEYSQELIENFQEKLNFQYDKESIWVYCKNCKQVICRKFYFEDRSDHDKYWPSCDYYQPAICTCHECEFLDLESLKIRDIFKIILNYNRNYGTIMALLSLSKKKELQALMKLYDMELKAMELMNEIPFKTAKDTEDIYYYNDGTYHSGGEVLIKEKAEKLYPNININKANEIIFHIRAKTYTDRNEFNKHKNFVFLKNGIFDLISMEPLDFNPEFISTVQIPIEYNKDAKCPNIMKFMNEIISKEDALKIQELIGFCLLKDYRYHKAFLLEGNGSNGKTTLLSLIIKFLGEENVSTVAMQAFDKNTFASAQLYNKLANIVDDLPSNAMRYTGIFKMLCGGGTVYAEQKWKEPFSFKNYAKLIFSTNQAPSVKDTSDAFYRRIEEVNFPNTFEGENKDPDLLEKLIVDEEMSGLFNWAIEGLIRLKKNRKFSYELDTDERREHYLRSVNSLYAFIQDMTCQKQGNRIIKDDFFSMYSQYCTKFGLSKKAKNVVGRELLEHAPYARGDRESTGKRRYVWCNIGLVGNVEEIEILESIEDWDTVEETGEEKIVEFGKDQKILEDED